MLSPHDFEMSTQAAPGDGKLQPEHYPDAHLSVIHVHQACGT